MTSIDFGLLKSQNHESSSNSSEDGRRGRTGGTWSIGSLLNPCAEIFPHNSQHNGRARPTSISKRLNQLPWLVAIRESDGHMGAVSAA
jgi:hypothetical protein